MGFRHFTHDHELSLYQEGEKEFEKTICDGCDEVICGPAYHCDTCERFILHQSCFGLPKEINSPLHHSADHPLILLPETSSGFICNGCKNFCVGFVYNCSECEFNLDVGCAFLEKYGKSKSSSEHQRDDLITEIEHFLDPHKLFLFYYRKQDEKKCRACNLNLSSDACYGCLKCYFFLHKSCLQIPKSMQHPYHPHSLYATSEAITCLACKTSEINLRYWCSEDHYFGLHLLCAKNSIMSTPPLRHKCHYNHDLYCFVPHDSIGSHCKCNRCDQYCENAFYRCFECDFNVHLKCIPIPPKVDYQWHWHPLTLKDSFREDDSDVYYCYACEKRRNPNFPVYWCEECPADVPYVAHVECIVSEEDEFRRSSWNTSPKAVDEGSQVEPEMEEEGEEEEEEEEEDSMTQIDGLRSHWHDHPLTLNAKEGMEIIPCDVCESEIQGDIYTCEICSDIHFHPSCAKCPKEITNPLHIHSLLGVSPNAHDYFICGLCKNVTNGYRFTCYQCCLTLEAKCAFLINDQYQDWNEKIPEGRIRHFIHPHELIQFKCTSDVKVFCGLCRYPVSDTTYCCLDCAFFIHKSCAEIQQQIIQPSYHLPHRLIAQDFGERSNYCGFCGFEIENIGYSCYECQFFVHFMCGVHPISALKHKFHQHSLFSVPESHLRHLDYDRDDSFRCCKCFGKFRDSFYRCVECKLNIHLECIPLPKIVKHSSHCDPLTLMSSMCEDDSGVYVCDVCQKLRNPNHPVYWCMECQLAECPFAAHVECVIQEGDASLEVISWEDSKPIFGSLFDLEEEINDHQWESKS